MREVDVKELGTVAHLSRETTENYLTALKALYLVDGLLPWAGSDYVKLGKRTKHFVADSGLLANALEWDEDAAYYDDDKCGKLVETWVHNELACLADREGGMKLFQYRDSDKREIDFIVQNSEGAMLGIEVKSGTVTTADFKHLRWFAANLAKTSFTGIVLYSGKDVLSFGEGFYAVPLVSLGLCSFQHFIGEIWNNSPCSPGGVQIAPGGTVSGTVGAHLAKVSLNSTDPVLCVNGRYRRFMPREVARIQSFPDTYRLDGPESRQYRALGNAIPPVLAWHVMKSVVDALPRSEQQWSMMKSLS